LIVCGAI